MKVFLLHRDRDFEPKPELRDAVFGAMVSGKLLAIQNLKRDLERRPQSERPVDSQTSDNLLAQDLELGTLWRAMAAGDEFLFETVKRVTLTSLRDPEAIRYRQQVLADCIARPAAVQQMYELALEALEAERRVGWWHSASPGLILRYSVAVLKLHLDVLRRLRELAEEQSEDFKSEGFARFFAMLREELADDYLETVERRLRELELKRGLLESAELGKGDRGYRYIFHEPPRTESWKEMLPLVGPRKPAEYSFELHPRDEAGARALDEISTRGLSQIAEAVGQSADHVKSFFAMLRLELAFYLGCLNLRGWLDQKGEPTCFPEPLGEDQLALGATGIYDVCLTFHLDNRVVGNELNADGKSLVVITGANQGGKSTLLRSLGLAHLMMQSGMFVGAQSFRASVCAGLFTHYKREEDATMESGKLDEELKRMSEIADAISPHSLLLCNESFAATNEREGSEIARQVVHAMLDTQIRVVLVTHMYDLAHSLQEQLGDVALFLRAERQPDGQRTFKLLEGEPLPTSYGQDAFARIFGRAIGSGSPGGRPELSRLRGAS